MGGLIFSLLVSYTFSLGEDRLVNCLKNPFKKGVVKISKIKFLEVENLRRVRGGEGVGGFKGDSVDCVCTVKSGEGMAGGS